MLAARSSVGSPRLRAMAGSAVVTIVLSSVSMKNAAATMSGIRRDNAPEESRDAAGGSTVDSDRNVLPLAAGRGSGRQFDVSCPGYPHLPQLPSVALSRPHLPFARRITSYTALRSA